MITPFMRYLVQPLIKFPIDVFVVVFEGSEVVFAVGVVFGGEGIKGFDLFDNCQNLRRIENSNARTKHDTTANKGGSERVIEGAGADCLFRLWVLGWGV